MPLYHACWKISLSFLILYCPLWITLFTSIKSFWTRLNVTFHFKLQIPVWKFFFCFSLKWVPRWPSPTVHCFTMALVLFAEYQYHALLQVFLLSFVVQISWSCPKLAKWLPLLTHLKNKTGFLFTAWPRITS